MCPLTRSKRRLSGENLLQLSDYTRKRKKVQDTSLHLFPSGVLCTIQSLAGANGDGHTIFHYERDSNIRSFWVPIELDYLFYLGWFHEHLIHSGF